MTKYQPLWQQAGSYAASVDRGLLGALWLIAVLFLAAFAAAGSLGPRPAAVSAAAPGEAAVP